MNISPKRSRSPGQRFARRRASLVRVTRLLGTALIMSFVLPALMTVFATPAFADDKEAKDYSLYKLASNASAYFSTENSPENKSGVMTDDWVISTRSAATGGNMLGFADKDVSIFDAVGWLFTGETASTQLISYDTLKESGPMLPDGAYAGMLDYAHFGAVNNNLGLDSMSSGDIGKMIAGIGGGIIWLAYALALTVSMLFFFIIQLLKLLNPFGWFFDAVVLSKDSEGAAGSAAAIEKASGMTGGMTTELIGIQGWITQWYTQIHAMSWAVLVPLFVGFLIIGLVLFKKMDRGSAIKKLVVRLLFLGFGLPLMGSLYSGVLNTFDDSLAGQHSGPTRVVLSTYVDFEQWMMRDRLAIPGDATIEWEGDKASDRAMMAVRQTALAINKQSHDILGGAENNGNYEDATSAWKNSNVGMGGGDASVDMAAMGTTFGIIQKYMIGEKAAAADFESGVKSAITKLDVNPDEKKKWFVDKRGYGDAEGFGEEGEYPPLRHPVLSVGGSGGTAQGLVTSNPGTDNKRFTTTGSVTPNCGTNKVWDSESGPIACNLSVLSAYNYLNTRFDSKSMTVFSSDKVMSGLTREDHMAVSQVGTGPAKFMYWSNAVTVLGSLVLLGFWYAIGMLAGAIKRTVGLVTAIPFATMGAMGAISKVIIYTVALVSEVLVTLFIYQFVSQLLISIPDVIAGPVSSAWGSTLLGGIGVVVLTLVSTLLVIGVTFALMRVRKVVLQAMDEVFTKLVDKFLETNTAPKPDKAGMLPALAAGAGAGAGMALGNRMASKLGPKAPNTPGAKTGGNPKQVAGTTNAGGLNNPAGKLDTGKSTAALEPGQSDGKPISDTPSGPQGPEGTGGGGQLALPGEHDSGVQNPSGGGVGTGGTANADRAVAEGLSRNGGLSNLGYDLGDKSRGGAGGTSGNGSDSGRRGRSRGSSGTSGLSGATEPTLRSGRRGSGSPSLGGSTDAPRTRAGSSPRVHSKDRTGRGAFEVGSNGVASSQPQQQSSSPRSTSAAPATPATPRSGRRVSTPGSQPVQPNPSADAISTPGSPRRRRLGERGSARTPVNRKPKRPS